MPQLDDSAPAADDRPEADPLARASLDPGSLDPGPLDLGPLASRVRRSLNGAHPGVVGTRLPPLVDHHVHLMIIGPDALVDSALGGVLDLGAPLDVVTALRGREGLPRTDFAGAFLTAPGGYPVGRSWAADGCAHEVPLASDAGRGALPSPAEAAVAEQHAFGASVIKVALNAAAGPVFDTATLDAIVTAAHERRMPVVAHVEGEGMTRLAIEAGVDALAHTPFTERVDDELVARAVALGQRWISTLYVAGHGERTPDAERAVDNLRRFHAAGGRVLYGTDLGNGDQPLGVNPRELELLVEAGLAASDVLEALTDPWPRDEPAEGVVTFAADPAPENLDDLATWLAAAVVVPAEEAEELETL
ncbi:amidohydrolase family protein [Agromyces sp. Leaf222]|uniref:amidohydrolase family protein n=1 Tax=Agromyces sp. Leaf222 TaxID=1735688 RepID=UPI000B20C5F5|nr:amidohydrolase family protein [Agromyces sp. Leaf222]